MISWSISDEMWQLLAKRWWKKVLCLECYIELVSIRQRHLVILSLADFSSIVIAGDRVRGYLTNEKWPWKKEGNKWIINAQG
jgi:hypothetical protein